MRLVNKIVLCLLSTGWLAGAAVGTASAKPLHEVCKADIDHYCDTVSTGNGRLMACLYAHENKISDECDAATDDVSAILDTVLAKIEEVQAECAPDLQKLCSNVKYGEGRILTCLKDNQASLSDGCKNAMPPIADGLGQ